MSTKAHLKNAVKGTSHAEFKSCEDFGLAFAGTLDSQELTLQTLAQWAYSHAYYGCKSGENDSAKWDPTKADVKMVEGIKRGMLLHWTTNVRKPLILEKLGEDSFQYPTKDTKKGNEIAITAAYAVSASLKNLGPNHAVHVKAIKTAAKKYVGKRTDRLVALVKVLAMGEPKRSAGEIGFPKKIADKADACGRVAGAMKREGFDTDDIIKLITDAVKAAIAKALLKAG